MIHQLAQLVRSARIDLSSEKRAQTDIETVLADAGLAFTREVRLCDADIVDFMVGDIALELKLKGARKMDVFRQLERYAKHPRVGSLLLASNLSMGLPPAIAGKPAYFVRLGEAWL